MTNQRATVAIVRTGPHPHSECIQEHVKQAVALAGGLPESVRPGALVLLKPNMVVVPSGPEAGICTHAEVTKAVADLVAERGARPVIAEASALGHDTLTAMAAMGYGLLQEAGYELVDLNKSATVTLPISGGRAWSQMDTFELAQRADAIISLPVLKMHCQATLTCSLKNIMGLATGTQKHGFHYRALWDSLVDINLLHRPCFAVVDALTVMEGLGPTTGQLVAMGMIMAGRDLVAVDATGARVMGLDPLVDVQTIARAAASGLGVAEEALIDVVGEPVASVRIKALRPEEDPQARWERVQVVRGATENGCVSCLTSLAAAFPMSAAKGLPEALHGRTYLIGDAPIPAGLDPAQVVPIGRCCSPALQALPRWVKGCAPRSNEIIDNSL